MLRLISISANAILSSFIPESIPLFIANNTIGNPAVLSLVGVRLLLNMKEAGAKGLNQGVGGSGGSRFTVSGMDFATPPAQMLVASHADSDGGQFGEIEMVNV